MRRFGVGLIVAGLVIAMTAGSVYAGQGNVKKFCSANRALDVAFSADQPDVARVNRLLDAVSRTAPPAIVDAVAVAVPAFKANPETAFEDPAVADAVGEIEAYEYESCGYEQVDVTLEDYAFTGLPSEIPRGTTVFRLTNEGAEAHEIFIVKPKRGTTLDDLLAADEAEFEDLARPVGGGFALPGEEGFTTVSFKQPGQYYALCFIPVGTTSETTEGTGPPHTAEGMTAEFEVSK